MKVSIKIALFYLILGSLWIILSDRFLSLLLTSYDAITFYQTIKGVFFVLFTASLLFVFSKKMYKKIESERDTAKGYINSIPSMLLSLNLNGEIAFINKKGLELIEYNESECIGKNVFQLLISEKDREKMEKVFNDIIKREVVTPAATNVNMITKNGREITFDVKYNCIRDKKGNLTDVLFVGEDITEKLFSKRLAEKMLYVVEQSPNTVVITDTDGVIEYVNKKFSELTLYTKEEVIGKKPNIFKSGTTPKRVYEELWNTIKAGRIWEGEMLNRKKNGELYWERAKIAPIFDPVSGSIANFVGIKEDITYKKKLEEQLLQSQKMEAIGHLAGGVAHDFNNILTAIIGYGNSLLLKLPKDDPLRTYVDQILVAAERAAALTQNLLSFARKKPLLKSVVDLNNIIERISNMVKRIIGEDIIFNMFLNKTSLNIYADISQIEQVVMNITTNARDAMEKGGSFTIETSMITMDDEFISKHVFGKEGEYAVLKLSDTGHGMSEEVKRNIFEPFYTTKGAGRGTGLGLSTVYGIVKSHDGFIDVESQIDKGTTFYIYFPLIGSSVEAEERVEMKQNYEGNETILIAEDDSSVLELFKDFFESFGYKVISVTNGDDAVKAFMPNKDKIALCILDIVMPVKSGPDALKEILSIKPGTKALLLSGYAIEIERYKSDFSDNVIFVQKPISPRKLVSLSRELIDRYR